MEQHLSGSPVRLELSKSELSCDPILLRHQTDPVVSPVTPAPSEFTVSTHVARALIEAVEQVGISADSLLEGAGISIDQLEDAEGRMERSQVMSLCEVARRLTGDPAFALHWAMRLGESSWLPVSNLIVHSENVREGLAALRRYSRLLTDEVRYSFIEIGDEFIVRTLKRGDEPLSRFRFMSEMTIMGFLNQMRRFDPLAQARRVNFEYADPGYREEYDLAFNQSVYFAQPHTEIIFARALLDQRYAFRDSQMHDALQEMADRRLLRVTRRTPYAARVHEFLLQQPFPQRCDMERVAVGLGLSERTLRRKLTAEGKTFVKVTNEALAIVARRLVRNEQLSIDSISEQMGFSSKSTFYRAFRRWTGMTPNEYRLETCETE